MQCYFDGNEHEISCNETPKRSKTPFSTRKELEHKCSKGKKAFHKVLSSVGGIENARTVADIPINYKQVCGVSQKSQSEEELIEILNLNLCRDQERPRNAFIRDVRTSPEKRIFLATNTQLTDV